MDINELTSSIIGCAIEVHKELGPGLLESVYKECLFFELKQAGFQVEKEVSVPILYKGHKLSSGFRIDLLVENRVIIELKAVTEVHPIYEAQTLTYLKLKKAEIGLLINFNEKMLKDGIQRVIR